MLALYVCVSADWVYNEGIGCSNIKQLGAKWNSETSVHSVCESSDSNN